MASYVLAPLRKAYSGGGGGASQGESGGGGASCASGGDGGGASQGESGGGGASCASGGGGGGASQGESGGGGASCATGGGGGPPYASVRGGSAAAGSIGGRSGAVDAESRTADFSPCAIGTTCENTRTTLASRSAPLSLTRPHTPPRPIAHTPSVHSVGTVWGVTGGSAESSVSTDLPIETPMPAMAPTRLPPCGKQERESTRMCVSVRSAAKTLLRFMAKTSAMQSQRPLWWSGTTQLPCCSSVPSLFLQHSEPSPRPWT